MDCHCNEIRPSKSNHKLMNWMPIIKEWLHLESFTTLVKQWFKGPSTHSFQKQGKHFAISKFALILFNKFHSIKIFKKKMGNE